MIGIEPEASHPLRKMRIKMKGKRDDTSSVDDSVFIPICKVTKVPERSLRAVVGSEKTDA